MSSGRQSVKAASFAATRESMTRRRTEWTEKIRKQKKEQLLFRRRHVVADQATTRVAAPIVSLVELANRVTQQQSSDITLETLMMFQSALSSSTNSTPGDQIKPEALANPNQMIHNLVAVLSDHGNAEKQLAVTRILTNLAAADQAFPESNSYYGRAPKTWTDLLVQYPPFSVTLHQVLRHNDLTLVLQCCWCIGNLASDSPPARQALLPLVGELARFLQQQDTTAIQYPPSVCRNAAWALSNLARGDGAPASLFCGPLTADNFFALLMGPERFPPSTDDVAWWDVAQEVIWILAFLSAKEDDAVDHILQASIGASFSSQAPPKVVEALAIRLSHAVRILRQSESLSSTESSKALSMIVPCVRAVGNVASACEGRHLPAILEAHSKSIVSSLATLVDLGSFPSALCHDAVSTVAMEASWACRTLLCDAGLSNHSSTLVAAPILVPKLCASLTSNYAKLSVKREALSALWTATAAPPRDISMGSVWSTRSTRDEMLLQIATTSKVYGTLVTLLRSADTDVCLLSLQLVNAILRRLEDQSYVLQFEELDGVDALEHICDAASSAYNYGSGVDWSGESPSADIAADLLDDLFGKEDDDNEGEMVDIAPRMEGNTFAFGMAVDAPVVGMGRGRGRPVPAWMSQM